MADSDGPPITALPDIGASGHPPVPTSDHPDGDTAVLPASAASVLLTSYSSNTVCPPQLVSPRERLAWEEFITGVSPLTQIVYARAIRRFLHHLKATGVPVRAASPTIVHDYIDTLVASPGHRQHRPLRPASTRTRKQHLAAIRHLYHHLVLRHAAVINPAASVRSPRLVVERGETAAIRPEQVRAVLGAIDTDTPIGHRDHTIISVLTLTAARVGAVARLRRGSVTVTSAPHASPSDNIVLEEKNARRRRLPLTGELRSRLAQWLDRLGPCTTDAPLFPSMSPPHTTPRAVTAHDILRMVRRRLEAAGIVEHRLTCHSFRAGAATALLESGVDLTRVQDLLGHADPRTSRMYDARSRHVRQETLERLTQVYAEG